MTICDENAHGWGPWQATDERSRERQCCICGVWQLETTRHSAPGSKPDIFLIGIESPSEGNPTDLIVTYTFTPART